MPSITSSFTSEYISRQLKQNAVTGRQVASKSEERKSVAQLGAQQLIRKVTAEAQSAQNGVWKDNATNATTDALKRGQVASGQMLTLANQLLAIANQASGASETATTRAKMQDSVDAILSQMTNLIRATTNSAGRVLMDGTIVNFAATAGARLAAVNGSVGAAGVTTARNSEEANIAIQALFPAGGATALTQEDIISLNAVQQRVASAGNGDTAAEFLSQAFQVMSGVQVDSQLYAARTADCIKATRLMRLLNSVDNGNLSILVDAMAAAGGGGVGAPAAVSNVIPRLVAAMLNEAVPAAVNQTGADAPVGAPQIARSAAFAALLSDQDKANLRAFCTAGGGGDVAVGGAALGTITQARAYEVLRCIGCFDNLIRADAALAAGGAATTGILGAVAVADVAPASVGLMARAGDTPMAHINVLLTQRPIQLVAAGTNLTATVSTGAAIPVNMPNLSTANLNLQGLTVRGATGDQGRGAATIANTAISQLAAAAVSLNTQVDIMESTIDGIQDAKDDYDSIVDNVTKPDIASTSDLLASLRRASGMLMTLLAFENMILSKQAQVSEQVAAG